MTPSHANRAYHDPRNAIDHHFGPDASVRKGMSDGFPLLIGRETVLTETIPKQTAEQRLSAAVAYDTGVTTHHVAPLRWVRRPENVETRPQSNFAQQDSRLAPDYEPPNPKTRL